MFILREVQILLNNFVQIGEPSKRNHGVIACYKNTIHVGWILIDKNY